MINSALIINKKAIISHKEKWYLVVVHQIPLNSTKMTIRFYHLNPRAKCSRNISKHVY